jgi:hypothetical protein
VKLALALVTLAIVAGCSIDHRTDQYACSPTAPCGDGRVCDQGFCVVAGTIDAPRGDGPPSSNDANNCPAPCTSCNVQQKTCTVNCQLTSCASLITCPAGYKCDIQCNTDNACRSGISCQTAAGCTIECSGRQACEKVQCGPGPCAVTCSGPNSCRDVACNNSCACDVICTGNQSCSRGIQCTSFACRNPTGPGCTSMPSFCRTCN